MNIVETIIRIKFEEEFAAGINVAKEIDGDNDIVPKEESSRAYGKYRYKSEERTDEVTGNKEMEQANTETAVDEDIAFWSWNCSGQLLVNPVTLGHKKLQNKNDPFAPTVRPRKNSPRVKLLHWFCKTVKNGEAVLK